jgi:hypothetical protein
MEAQNLDLPQICHLECSVEICGSAPAPYSEAGFIETACL